MRMHMLKWLIISFVLLFSPAGSTPRNERSKLEGTKKNAQIIREQRTKKIVEYCRSLTPGEAGDYRQYLKRLGAAGDFEALQAIYNSNFTFSSWAAREAARAMESPKVVRFCQQFELGSSNWQEAVMGLQYHPKESVIGYVKNCVTNADPVVRHYCYQLCLVARWTDLAEYAKEDIHSNGVVVIPNWDDNTLSGLSCHYLKECRRWAQEKVR